MFVVGVIRKIKTARNWFGRICVVFSVHLVGVSESENFGFIKRVDKG